MKPLPAEPFAFQARVFGALCDDLFDMASGKSGSCERTNALREVSKQSKGRECGLKSGSRTDQ